jgi:hypothetical protein
MDGKLPGCLICGYVHTTYNVRTGLCVLVLCVCVPGYSRIDLRTSTAECDADTLGPFAVSCLRIYVPAIIKHSYI